MLNIDTSDMISIGSFDYTINEAATLYLVDVNKSKPFYYLTPLSTACIHGLIVRYFNGWGGESFETFDEFVNYVTRQIEAVVHFATKIDVTNKTSAHAIKPPRKNEMNQSRHETWEPELSLEKAKVPKMKAKLPPKSDSPFEFVDVLAVESGKKKIPKSKALRVETYTGAELRKKARELLSEKPKPKKKEHCV